MRSLQIFIVIWSNAKVISVETIARVLDGEAEQQSKATDETTEPEKKSTKKKRQAKRLRQKQQIRLHLKSLADVKRKATPLR